MGREPRIVVLGDSVLMDSVADCLADRRMPGVVRPDSASIGKQIEYLKPDLVLLELGQPYTAQAIALLERWPKMTLIGLDLDSSQVIVLGSNQRVIASLEDLFQVIEAELQKRGGWAWGGEGDEMNCDNYA